MKQSYKFCPERNCMIDKDGFPLLNQAERADPNVYAPMVMSDIADHVWNGIVVAGRAGQRELRKTHGVVPQEAVSKHARKMPKRHFDEKDDHWQDWLKLTREDVAEAAGTTRQKVVGEMSARKAAGSLKRKVFLKADGKVDDSPRTQIHGSVDNPTIKTVAANEEQRIMISPEVREYAANRAASKARRKAA